MNHQSTNEEQFQEIKEFLAGTWKMIVAVIVIGLLAIWGWRYWQSHQTEKIKAASAQYEQLIAQLDNNARTSVDALVAFAKDSNTIYSVFANLRAAKFYVETLKDYTGAEALLTQALEKVNEEALQSIIMIQMARLQFQLEKYSDALVTLDKITEKDWAALANDVRGDILAKLQRYEEAINAYGIALISSPTPELEKNVQMKLNATEFLKSKQPETKTIK